MSKELLKLGVYVIGFFYPVVPRGQARIRVQISAAHSMEDIQKAIDSFVSVVKKLKLSSPTIFVTKYLHPIRNN